MSPATIETIRLRYPTARPGINKSERLTFYIDTRGFVQIELTFLFFVFVFCSQAEIQFNTHYVFIC